MEKMPKILLKANQLKELVQRDLPCAEILADIYKILKLPEKKVGNVEGSAGTHMTLNAPP